MTKQAGVNSMRDNIVALLPRLKRYALSLTGSMVNAEDLLHATVERALTKAEQFRSGTDLDRWMFRICRNLWLDECRAKKAHGEILPIDTPKLEPQIDGERGTTAILQLKELETTLARMQEDQREILMLILVEGYSYKEVSSLLDIPMGTVMSRLARARSQLAKLMANAQDIAGKDKTGGGLN